MSKDNSKVLLGSGLLLALASSLCCVVPVLAILGGLGGAASAFSWAAPLRPYLLGATALLLGFAFFRAYRPQPKDSCGCDEKRSAWQSKGFLWVVAAVSVLLSTFPYYAGAFERKVVSPVVVSGPVMPAMRQAIIHVRGMGCADCERLVDHALLATPGVLEAHTSFAKEEAVVRYDSACISVGDLGAAVERETGYKVIR